MPARPGGSKRSVGGEATTKPRCPASSPEHQPNPRATAPGAPLAPSTRGAVRQASPELPRTRANTCRPSWYSRSCWVTARPSRSQDLRGEDEGSVAVLGQWAVPDLARSRGWGDRAARRCADHIRAEDLMALLTVNGTELYYELRGGGPPVLLIMGFTGDGGNFKTLADVLVDEFTVICYDRRGNGRSPRPA